MPETQTTEKTQESRPSLTLQDLSLVVQLLDVGSQRGAWKAEELSTVGGLYDRISAFVKSATVPAPQEPAEPGPAQ